MKKIVFSFLVLSMSLGVYAQSKRVSLPAHIRNQAVEKQTSKNGTETLQQPALSHPVPSIVVTNHRNAAITAESIGDTQYDLQTNGSPGERIVNYGSGVISATWTMSVAGASGFPDRGTGYNHRNGSTWGALPTARIESVRTGWPSITNSGTKESIFAHNFPTAIISNYQTNFTPPWTAGASIPTQTGLGIAWPRTCVSGNYLHAIAVTDPSGPAYHNVKGQLLYFRSPDGGVTWDLTDVELPSTTSSDWTANGGDSYAIYARGNNVVIASFYELSGVLYWKSTDNGQTFTKVSVAPFPIPAFDPSVVGNTTDVDGDLIIDTVFTCDGAGDVVLDANGNIHLVWGLTRVIDDGADDKWSYFPFTEGVLYWNETRAANDIDTIGFLQDRNGDDIFNLFATALPPAQVSATSHANIGVDACGRIFVAYSALVDSTRDADDEPYRHVFVTGSQDGGATWNDAPEDIITDDIFGVGASEFVEATFPAMADNIDDKLHLIYQVDGDAGVGLQQATPVAQQSSIYYSTVDVNGVVSCLGVTQPYTDINRSSFKMTPNPAIDYSTVDFALALDSEVSINVMDVNGAIIRTQNLGKLNAGSNQAQLNVSDLAAGIYMVRINTANGSITGKMVVVKK